MKTYTYQYGIAYHTDTESWGPLAVLCTIDGVGQDVTRFQTRKELDLFMLESIIPNCI